MGGEWEGNRRSMGGRPNPDRTPVGEQSNTNRTPVGVQWEGIEGQWEVNGRKIGKNVKKRENHQRNVNHGDRFLILPAKTPYLFHNEWYFQFDVIKPSFIIGINMFQDLPLQPAVVRTLGQRLKRCVTW